MPTLSDPADALLARADDLEISTQHTMALDSAPDFHADQESEEALFAGLAGRNAKRVKMPAKAGVRQVQARVAPSAGFLPGMGDLDGKPGMRAAVRRPAPPRPSAGFLPGMGDLDGKPAKRAVAMRRPARPVGRPSAGFLPGMGDFSIAGMGLGTLALLGVGAWFLFGRKRA